METGLILSDKDIRDYRLAKNIIFDLPTEFKLEKIPIKNQKNIPTCTAHSLASLVEYHTKKENGKYFKYSTDFIYGNRNEKLYIDEGMSLRDGLNVLYNYGDVLYKDCPGNSFYIKAKEKVKNLSNIETNNSNISAYYKINSLDELKYSLFNDGPVVASMKIFNNFALVDGIYAYDDKNDYSYHAVLIVGYDKDKLIIQNSWGSTWGKKGYFYIDIEDADSIICEMYGITDNIETIIKPFNNTEYIPKVINFLIFFIEKLFTFLKI